MAEQRINHLIQLKQRPVGVPTESNFEFVKTTVPISTEGQFLVRNIWMSVDPYMRGRMRGLKSYIPPFQLDKPLEGASVGQVIESKNNQFKVGDYVLSNFGWREYWLSSSGNGVTKIDPKIAPLQSYLGIMGLTGLTAYVGLLKIGELKDNVDVDNTVFISAAADAVGSAACQIAKINGCHVVGSTGSQEKLKWLIDEAKIDNAFNYNEIGEGNLSSELKILS